MTEPTALIVACPTCSKSVAWHKSAFRPFCSQRCQLQDRAAWATESYRIPGSADQPEDEAAQAVLDDSNNEK